MKKSSAHRYNVLDVRPDARQLWAFSPHDRKVKLEATASATPPNRLPPKLAVKDWNTLFKPKLNIAWLPADSVFIRAVHLPQAGTDELLSMVELQLEKLSPLPTGQIVWAAEPIGDPSDNLQTVLVLVVARADVEQFLGTIESEGYLPDRLEIPHLHQLLAKPIEADGVWIFLNRTQAHLALVAWFFGGVLRNVQIVHLPLVDAPQFLVDQLTKVAWAGEMEGWLTSPARVYLVSDPAGAESWMPALERWSGQPVEAHPALEGQALAEFAAGRAARSETVANLMPPEHASRYHQQFVDRLWMRGLGALILVYLAGIAVYFGAVQYLQFEKNRVEAQVSDFSQSYTNALRLKEHVDVLQNQISLKYAALDCWKAVSDRLPDGLTLTRLNLRDGRTVRIEGYADPDQTAKINDYNEELRRAALGGVLVFSQVNPPRIYNRQGSPGVSWDFEAELNRSQTE